MKAGENRRSGGLEVTMGSKIILIVLMKKPNWKERKLWSDIGHLH